MTWDTPTHHKAKDTQVADAKGGRFHVFRNGPHGKTFSARFNMRGTSIAIPPYNFKDMDEAKRACEAYAEGMENA